MDPSTMWRLQEACQRNLVERQRIRKRLQHLTGKRSGELLCNDKNRHCQADDWPCLTSFGVADARERMGAPAPQPPSSGPKRARPRKLKHSCNRYTGEMPPLELLVVGHQLPMHSLPMTTTRSHQPSEHLLQQHQHQQQQHHQQQQQQQKPQSQTHTQAQAQSQAQNQQAASSRRRAKAEPPYPNDFVYFLSRTCHHPHKCAQAQPQPQPQSLSAMHVTKHLVLDARFMAELLDEILL